MGSGLLSELKARGIPGPEALRGIIRGMRNVEGAGDVEVSDADDGLNVYRNTDGPAIKSIGPARITDAGPNGEADWTDERYWVTWLYATDTKPTARVTFRAGAVHDPAIVTATNLAECPTDGTAGTGLLPVGTRVWVWVIEDTAGGWHYLFERTPSTEIWGLITGATQDGSNKRWVYSFSEAEKTSAGYGGWTVVDGGTGGDCYNTAENINGATGVMGNGVSLPISIGTFDIQPIPDGTPVRLHLALVTDGDPEWWFTEANGIDGSCS